MCWGDCCEVMICLLTGRSTCAHPLIIIAVLNHVASLLRSQKDVAVRETCIPDPSGHNKLTASWVIGGPHAAGPLLQQVSSCSCTWHTGPSGPLGWWGKRPSSADISVNRKALQALRERRWTAPIKSVMTLVRPFTAQTEGACWEGPGGSAVVLCRFGFYLCTCFYFFFKVLFYICPTSQPQQLHKKMCRCAKYAALCISNVLPCALEQVLKCDELESNHSGKEAPDVFPLSPPNLQFWGRERHLKPPLISPSHTSLLPAPAKLAWKNKTGPGTEDLTTSDDLNAGALLLKKLQSLENGRLSFPPQDCTRSIWCRFSHFWDGVRQESKTSPFPGSQSNI